MQTLTAIIATVLPARRNGRPGKGFTLIELLLVLGLMALVAGAVSLGIRRGMAIGETRPPREVFYIAAAEARIRAMKEGRAVQLRFDEASQSFVLSFMGADSQNGARVASSSASTASAGDEASVPWVRRLAREQTATDEGADFAGLPQWREQAIFPLADGSDATVHFYALLGTERLRLPEPLTAIVFHPSGASTGAEVVIGDNGSGQKESLYPDSFSSGPRLAGQGESAAVANGAGRRGNW